MNNVWETTKLIKRHLKFRAWISDEELMLDVPCTDGDHISELTDEGIRITRFNDYIVKESGGNIIETEGYEECEAVILQFTGLTDKNGKEIYERDIVKSPYSENRKIIFEDGAFWVMSTQEYCTVTHLSEIAIKTLQLEVIGNIYEG